MISVHIGRFVVAAICSILIRCRAQRGSDRPQQKEWNFWYLPSDLVLAVVDFAALGSGSDSSAVHSPCAIADSVSAI